MMHRATPSPGRSGPFSNGGASHAAAFIPGDAPMQRAVHRVSWEHGPLGPIASWPASLRGAVNLCLNSPFPMAVLCGPQLLCIYNDAALSIYGDKHPSALGRPVADAWAEVWPTLGPLIEDVFKTGRSTRCDDLPLLIDRYGYVEEACFTFSYSPVLSEDNRIEGVFVTMLETTDRVNHERRLSILSADVGRIVHGIEATESSDSTRAEIEQRIATRMRELRETSRLLFAVFDRAPGGIAIADLDGRFIRANAAFQKLVGLSEKELLSRSMQSVTDPRDYPRKQALLQRLLCGETDSFQMEMRYIHADGSVLWVNNFVSTIDDEDRRPRYFIKITQDIADRKRAEEEILASQHELRQLYDRLQTVREEEKAALAREVHDQLGQVLSAAKIDIALLEEDIRPRGASLSRSKILSELRSAHGMLDQAIGMVRQIATQLRVQELEEHGLYAAITWHACDFERRTRIACSVALPNDSEKPAGAVATALFRIFQEAMTNVLRHAKARRVHISLMQRGTQVVLRVRDDGVGIARARWRGMRSLGLTGMRERAALVNGRLRIGPLPEGGTLVSVHAPWFNVMPSREEQR